jgi:hypothetical protein
MPTRKTPNTDDRTEEITGYNASMDEAEIGTAGNGADIHGADLTGGVPIPIQDEPDFPDDILPDQIEHFNEGGERDEEVEVTAQPSENPPADSAELP